MGLIFDTSVLIALERSPSTLEEVISGREEEAFGICAITAAELLHGVLRANSEARRLVREAFVEKIIEIFPVLPFELAAARIYALLWASLQKKGAALGAHDVMIAATAISLGYSLLTSDAKHFGRIEGLTVRKFPEPLS